MTIFSQQKAHFTIGELFHVGGCSKRFTSQALAGFGSGDHPYITTSASNNGISGYSSISTEQGNVITVDSATVGSAFYQKYPFTGSDHVEKLTPKTDKNGDPLFVLNEQIGLFICAALKQEMFRYSYGRKFNQTRIRSTKIILPLMKSARPNNGKYSVSDIDWQGITDHVSFLMKGSITKLSDRLQKMNP